MTTSLLGVFAAVLLIIAVIYICFGKKKDNKEPPFPEAEQDGSNVDSLLGALCDYKTMANKGFSQDMQKSLVELSRAAEKNHAEAEDFLASFYYDALTAANSGIPGESAEETQQKAFYWNNKAAKQNRPDARYRLATMYLDGRGADKNEERAVALLSEAGESGHKKATLLLSSIYYKAAAKAEGKHIVNEQRWKDIQQKAFYWVNKAAEQGNQNALYCLGSMYMAGQGVRKSRDKAMFLFIEAAESGNLEASATLGTMYFDQGNKEKAIFWFEKAAARNHATSMFFLGMIYMEKMQLDKADDFFAKAAKLGCKSSKDLLHGNKG